MRALCLFAFAMIFPLAGCASMNERSGMSDHANRDNIDRDKVAMINHIARHRGVVVIWVNPPEKKHAGAPGS